MGTFWDRMIYADIKAKHICDDFGVALACDGESDFMICRKCGKGWIAPCSNNGKAEDKEANNYAQKFLRD